jgi:hypothetical protein
MIEVKNPKKIRLAPSAKSILNPNLNLLYPWTFFHPKLLRAPETLFSRQPPDGKSSPLTLRHPSIERKDDKWSSVGEE